MFFVKNQNTFIAHLKDNYINIEIQVDEVVDLEAIFSHEQLYYSSQPNNALWDAIENGLIVRRDNLNVLDISKDLAFYDAIWRYSPNQGQWEALVGTVPIPSATNRYVTEADFGTATSVQTIGNVPEILYEVEVPTNSTMFLQSQVLAVKISGNSGSFGDSASFIKICVIKNIDNMLSLKVVESSYTFRDQEWQVFFETIGNKTFVYVQGAIDTTVNWSGLSNNKRQSF